MDVHGNAVASRPAHVYEGTPALLATWTTWFSVLWLRVVKKAEGTSVGTQLCTHGHTANRRSAMVSMWGMQRAHLSPNLGLAQCACTHTQAHQHTHGHRCKHVTPLLVGRLADRDPLQRHGGPHQEWGTAEVSKALPPKFLQQLAGAGVQAKPTTCLLKAGLNDAVAPPPPLSLTSSPRGNHHLYMRFSFFFLNLFSALCPIELRGLAARLGLPAFLKAGCFNQPPHGNLPEDNFGQCLRCFPANLYHLIPAGIDSPFLTRPPANPLLLALPC